MSVTFSPLTLVVLSQPPSSLLSSHLWLPLLVSLFLCYVNSVLLRIPLVNSRPCLAPQLGPLARCGASFGDPSLSTTSTLEHIPSSAARPRPLVRQQSLQQPLTHQPPPGPNDPPVTSQSLGQLHTGPGGGGHRGGPRGVRGSPAGAGASRYRSGGGARSRSNPGSWDHMMGQIRTRGMDVKSFLWVLHATKHNLQNHKQVSQTPFTSGDHALSVKPEVDVHHTFHPFITTLLHLPIMLFCFLWCC